MRRVDRHCVSQDSKGCHFKVIEVGEMSVQSRNLNLRSIQSQSNHFIVILGVTLQSVWETVGNIDVILTVLWLFLTVECQMTVIMQSYFGRMEVKRQSKPLSDSSHCWVTQLSDTVISVRTQSFRSYSIVGSLSGCCQFKLSGQSVFLTQQSEPVNWQSSSSQITGHKMIEIYSIPIFHTSIKWLQLITFLITT